MLIDSHSGKTIVSILNNNYWQSSFDFYKNKGVNQILKSLLLKRSNLIIWLFAHEIQCKLNEPNAYSFENREKGCQYHKHESISK